MCSAALTLAPHCSASLLLCLRVRYIQIAIDTQSHLFAALKVLITLSASLLPQVRCIQIAIDNPANKGEMRVFNQFTEMFRCAAFALANKSNGAGPTRARCACSASSPRCSGVRLWGGDRVCGAMNDSGQGRGFATHALPCSALLPGPSAHASTTPCYMNCCSVNDVARIVTTEGKKLGLDVVVSAQNEIREFLAWW